MNIPIEINELQSNITVYTKFNSEWTKDLHDKAKTLNLLKENSRVKLYIPGVSKNLCDKI